MRANPLAPGFTPREVAARLRVGLQKVLGWIARGELRLHLSEHHGDGSPGVHIHVEMAGVDEFHREVSAKGYRFLRPGVQDEFYGARAMHVIDPFGNRISFEEFKTPAQ